MAQANKKWFQKGAEGAAKSEAVDTEQRIRREQNGPMRFWLDHDQSAKVTFLDNPSFFLWEHNMKIGANFNNFFTCLRDFDTCPLCESGLNPSYIVVGTIISHKPYTDKNGVTIKSQKQLYVAKGAARNIILKKAERNGKDLTYAVMELARGNGTNEPNVGQDIEFVKRLTKEQVQSLRPAGVDANEWIKPFDYEKIFNPKTPDELRKLVGLGAPIGSAEEQQQKAPASDGGDIDSLTDDGGNASSPAPASTGGGEISSIDDLL